MIKTYVISEPEAQAVEFMLMLRKDAYTALGAAVLLAYGQDAPIPAEYREAAYALRQHFESVLPMKSPK